MHAHLVNREITSRRIECTWLNLYKFTGYEARVAKLFFQLEDTGWPKGYSFVLFKHLPALHERGRLCVCDYVPFCEE